MSDLPDAGDDEQRGKKQPSDEHAHRPIMPSR
jgi:hypothetical protein